MTERQEQMIFNEGYRRGKAERHKMLEDGTLVVSVNDATAVTRVLVEDGQKNGDLYYADRPKGEWRDKEVFNENNDDHYVSEWQSARCSNCGKYHTTPYRYYFDNFNFCPECGADMKGADDE